MKTSNSTKKSILSKAGLTGTQTETFAFLLEHGEKKASAVAKGTKRPRGVAYKALEELLELGLVEKIEKGGKIATFRPVHPSVLEKFFENKEKQAKKDKEQFFASLPDLVSLYNLSTQRPGVTYFEGDEGVTKLLDDTLTSNTDVYMYGDIETSMKYMQKINEEYAKKRKGVSLHKKMITPDTQFARKFFSNYMNDLNENRFIPKSFFPFGTSSMLQIYDGKILYATVDDKQKIGVLIHDRNLFMLLKQIFEFTWHCADIAEKKL